MQTSEVLHKAADLIEERGWTTGSAGMNVTNGDPLCLMGAIGAATGTRVVAATLPPFYAMSAVQTCPAGLAVHRYLGLVPTSWIYEWNDYPERTATEVIEVLRAAALIEQAREDASLLAEAGRV